MNEHFYTSNVRWKLCIFSCLLHTNGIRALRFMSFYVPSSNHITQYSKPLLGCPGRQLRNIELPSERRHVLSMRSVTSGTIVLPVEKCSMCMYKVIWSMKRNWISCTYLKQRVWLWLKDVVVMMKLVLEYVDDVKWVCLDCCVSMASQIFV